jgi:beta-galactosidase/beta-glucuronidase
MHPHRIRLKGPWEYEWRSSSATADAATAAIGFPRTGRVKMPASWQDAFGDEAGEVKFRRRFQKPTNLDPHERVSLVFDGIGGTGRVALNGQELGSVTASDDTQRYDVTLLLQASNELLVELAFEPRQSGSATGGLWGPVVIEISR